MNEVVKRIVCLGMGLGLFPLFALMPLEECREKAGYGNPDALYELGRRHEDGEGVRSDPLRAISYYRKAADKGHRLACQRMAVIYGRGLYVAKDSAKAAYYAEKGGMDPSKVTTTRLGGGSRVVSSTVSSSDEVSEAACRILGKNGYTKDAAAGTVLLFTAAKNGNLEAQRCFVEWMEQGVLDPEFKTNEAGWKLINAWYVDQFKKGNRLLGLTIGRKLRKSGQTVQALRYFEAAGSAGSAEACYEAGKMYWYTKASNGKDLAFFCSDERALKWFRKALEVRPEKWLKNDVMARLIVLHVQSKMCRDVKKAFDLGERLYVGNEKDAFCAYFYGYAGLVSVENWWRQLGVPRDDAQYRVLLEKFNTKRQQFWELVRTAVQNGQPDVLGLLKNE